MSRLSDSFNSVPICTVSLLVVNISVHVYLFVTSTPLQYLANSAFMVFDEDQYYRIVSSAFTHNGAMHILMNMMSLLQLGAGLEQNFGTVQFFLCSMWAIVLDGFLYCVINWFISVAIPGYQSYLYSSAVGYSGVLFSYAVISSYHTTAPTQSVFGLFSVPSKLYPWILLGIMQVILPGISLIGHLSGILVGLLAVYGVFDLVLIPSKGIEYFFI